MRLADNSEIVSVLTACLSGINLILCLRHALLLAYLERIYFHRWIANLKQLRVGLSKLNFHKFRHNFKELDNFFVSSERATYF